MSSAAVAATREHVQAEQAIVAAEKRAARAAADVQDCIGNLGEAVAALRIARDVVNQHRAVLGMKREPDNVSAVVLAGLVMAGAVDSRDLVLPKSALRRRAESSEDRDRRAAKRAAAEAADDAQFWANAPHRLRILDARIADYEEVQRSSPHRAVTRSLAEARQARAELIEAMKARGINPEQ